MKQIVLRPQSLKSIDAGLAALFKNLGLCGLLILLAASGCAGTQLFGLMSAKFEKATPANPAVEILSLWQASEGPGPNGVPTRGFAGQVFFFTQAKPVPVVVEGNVRIFLFDDRGTLKQQGRPIREFDFDSNNWNAHAHSSSLGPGYAVFIPYPRADFHQAACSLRIRFTPTVGPTIYSPTASVVLPGPTAKLNGADEAKPVAVTPSQAPQDLNAARLASLRAAMAAAARQPSSPTMDNSTPEADESSQPRVSRQPLPMSPQPSARGNVVPIAGTDADTRLAPDDDPVDDGGVRTAQYEQPAPRSRSHRIKLQSAITDSGDVHDEVQ